MVDRSFTHRQPRSKVARNPAAVVSIAKPPLKGLRQSAAQWLRPELRVRMKHLKAKGVLRHATVKQFIAE
jgi:hypothetical protein